VKVVAEGLLGNPIINSSGLFVWLHEDDAKVRKLSIDPGTLPYEELVLEPGKLNLPPVKPAFTTIELQPKVGYSFASGITGLRGALIEERVIEPEPSTPVPKAAVRLQWLDDDNNRRIAPTKSHTDPKRGDFVSILRLSPTEVPLLTDGEVTVRLLASRDGGLERRSDNFRLPQGRVTDPSTSNPLIFAWDELQP
jgi:hypothetical protein